MYQEAELKALRAQEKRRWALLAIPAAVLLALTVLFVIRRDERLTVVCSLLLGALLIAGWGLLIRPIHVYRKYVEQLLHGRRHTARGAFIGFDADESLVDDVRVRGLRLTCLDDVGKPYERLFYYDLEKPLPDLKEGQELEVEFHDRQVAALRAV